MQKIRGWRKFVLVPLVLFMKLFAATLRIGLSENLKKFLKIRDKSSIVAFWHQNLFLISNINWKLDSCLPTYGLISPSRDGAWLSAFFDLVGIKSVRGSSGRRGLSAMNELLGKLLSGARVAITPDGPRGPAKKFKHGTATLALRSRTKVVLLSVKYSSFWTLNTWDKFILPKPFSSVQVDCKEIPYEVFKTFDSNQLSSFLDEEILALEKCGQII